MDSSVPAGTLYGVFAASETLAYAVGDAGMVLKWSGGSWTKLGEAPGGPRLLSVVAFPKSSVWIYTMDEAGVIRRFREGGTWEQLSTTSNLSEHELSGTAPDDIWAVANDRLWHWPE
jgi:hypothetical protein